MEYIVILLSAFFGYQSCQFARLLYKDGYLWASVLVMAMVLLSVGLLVQGAVTALAF